MRILWCAFIGILRSHSGERATWSLQCEIGSSAGSENDSESFLSAPEVFSTSELFGSPYKPPLGPPKTLPLSSPLEGLTPSSPVELRKVAPEEASREDSLGGVWEVDEDGYIVEAVETFRFKVSADELERALKSRREMKVSSQGEAGGKEWDEDAFMMSEDMLNLLEAAQAQEDDAGAPVYRFEMEQDELSKMVRRRGDAGTGGGENWGKAKDFRGLAGSREVTRTSVDRADVAGSIAGGGQEGMNGKGNMFTDPDKAAAAAVSAATDGVQGAKSTGNTLAQTLQKGQRHPRNWFLSGVSRFGTASDLVGIGAISLGLTATVLLFDFASRVVVESVGPRLFAAVYSCFMRLASILKKWAGPLVFRT